MNITVDHVYRLRKRSLAGPPHRRRVVKSWMYYIVFCTETDRHCGCAQSKARPPIYSRCSISKMSFERFVEAGARKLQDVSNRL